MSQSPSSGAVWDLQPSNGLEIISGSRCFRLMRSLKTSQIEVFPGNRVNLCQLVLCDLKE